MTTLYILYSSKLNRYYVGITSESVDERLEKHNTSAYGRHYTSVANDWILKLGIPCETYQLARKMELYIKRMKSRVFVEKIIEQEDERNRLIQTIYQNINNGI